MAFDWKTHKLNILHETDERLTVRIRSREDKTIAYVARFYKDDDSVYWSFKDHRRLNFLWIDPGRLSAIP